MKQINVAVFGVGWIGENRAITCKRHPLVKDVYVAEVNPARSEAIQRLGVREWTTNYQDILTEDVDAVIVSAAPETTHYPMARDALKAGKHVLLEKPMAIKLSEADELLRLAREAGVKFTIGYTQRFNPKFAYLKQCVTEGKLGRPVSALISRHLTRSLGAKIAGRGDLGPAQMEATHDIDLALWWMAPTRVKKVYAQAAYGIMREPYDLPDSIAIILTMENGQAVSIFSSWNLPVEYPGFSSAAFEFTGSDGAMFIDDTHRDVLLSTAERGLIRPISTMPGQQVDYVFAGAMENETRKFIDCVALDEPVVVSPEDARIVMEVTLAADMSAEQGVPIELPLKYD
ncbi:MAG: Gfo/Idh/MocA family oxidoreductase [Chloroflexi bacterium]|nr:Gfo/Idh/MocA family oxidoreductase [Chloroflexota bacterium]